MDPADVIGMDRYLPRLSPLELAIAIDTCKEAGAVNAAVALSKHISRLEVEIEQLKKLAYIGEHHHPDLTYKVRLEELVRTLPTSMRFKFNQEN